MLGGLPMSALPRRIALLSLVAIGPTTACSSTPASSAGPPVSDAAAPIDGGTSAIDAGASPVVTLSDGPIQGHVDGSVYAFLGIPYAAPPVGGLRWKEPQPPTPWTGVRDGSQFGNRCAQNAS